jgi:hypothetical protein
MPAWDKGYETYTKSRPGSIPKDCYTLESVQEPNACPMAARNEPSPLVPHWRKRAMGPQGVQPQIPGPALRGHLQEEAPFAKLTGVKGGTLFWAISVGSERGRPGA